MGFAHDRLVTLALDPGDIGEPGRDGRCTVPDASRVRPLHESAAGFTA